MLNWALFMSDIVAQDRPIEKKASRFLAILILVALFVPHSLGIAHLNFPDNSYIRYTVSAVLWAISYENGSTIAGPYSDTSFEFLSIATLLFGALFLLLFISIIITQWRFIKGTTTKRSILRIIGLALIIQLFPISPLFSFRLTGLGYTQLYPLPIFHTLNVLSVVRQRGSESIAEPEKSRSKSSIRSIVNDAIITACFWCVSIVFFVIGGSMVISNLLMGLGFLALAIIVIIVWERSEYGT